MLSSRKRLFILIGVIVCIVGGVVLWIILTKKTPPGDVSTITPPVETPPIENVEFKKPEITTPTETTPTLSSDEVYAKQSARIFVERFLSYSNQNENQHIDDALLLAADSMREWILSQAKEQSVQYSGLTTEVLSSRILSYTPAKTSVEVGARQTTRTLGENGVIVEETKNVTLKVDLVKIGEKWLAEGLWNQ